MIDVTGTHEQMAQITAAKGGHVIRGTIRPAAASWRNRLTARARWRSVRRLRGWGSGSPRELLAHNSRVGEGRAGRAKRTCRAPMLIFGGSGDYNLAPAPVYPASSSSGRASPETELRFSAQQVCRRGVAWREVGRDHAPDDARRPSVLTCLIECPRAKARIAAPSTDCKRRMLATIAT